MTSWDYTRVLYSYCVWIIDIGINNEIPELFVNFTMKGQHDEKDKKVHTGAKRLCMREIDILEHHKANSSNFHTFWLFFVFVVFCSYFMIGYYLEWKLVKFYLKLVFLTLYHCFLSYQTLYLNIELQWINIIH